MNKYFYEFWLDVLWKKTWLVIKKLLTYEKCKRFYRDRDSISYMKKNDV